MSRVIQCELILPITAKFISVCTMYVQCTPRQLAWFHHGSWRVVCTEMNTIFGATFVGKRSVRCAHTAHASLMGAYAPKRSANRAWSRKGQRSSVLCLQRMAQLSDLVIWCARNWWMFGATVFCSLRSHGTRLLLTQQSKPCLVMGKAGVCACVVIS